MCLRATVIPACSVSDFISIFFLSSRKGNKQPIRERRARVAFPRKPLSSLSGIVSSIFVRFIERWNERFSLVESVESVAENSGA